LKLFLLMQAVLAFFDSGCNQLKSFHVNTHKGNYFFNIIKEAVHSRPDVITHMQFFSIFVF